MLPILQTAPKRHSLARIAKRRAPGAAPGTLIASPTALDTKVSVIVYGPKEVRHISDCGISELSALREDKSVLWIDVVGLGSVEAIKEIGEVFDIHNLSLEDVVNIHQRPKLETFENHLFVTTRMLTGTETLESEQLTLFLGDNYVVTFQERPGDCFDNVRRRIRRGKGRIRNAGADYLAYALLDSVVDSYFPGLEKYGELIEKLEDEVILHPNPALINDLHTIKRQLLNYRRVIWPTRELINNIIRDESELIGKETQIYFRDCYDHTIQLMDIIETYREIASGLIDIYLSSISTRMNEIMKVLTMIATIFIPLSFVTGLFGMNFDRTVSPWNMPELGWRYGYLMSLGAMGTILIGMLVYFYRKGWILQSLRLRRDRANAGTHSTQDT